MKRIILAGALALWCALAPSPARAANGTVSGPFTHRNLQIFLVHGDTQLENRRYATLSEAMEKGYVTVKETGKVEELTIENSSKNVTVFLNAGDIVKGGRQDRTIRDDLVLPPQSNFVPLASFCVENGRWTGRGSENAAAFSGNSKVLSSRESKLAVRGGVQSEVWKSVAEQQDKLNYNVSGLNGGRSVETRSPASATSLQLTLENKDLDDTRKQYLDKLSRILDGKTDVIGFVYVINGEINSAELYNNKSLFRALWPKLLDAAITEAITDYKNDQPAVKVEAADIKSFFTTALSGSTTERTVWKSTQVRTYTTPTTVLFETLDMEAGGAWVHKSLINHGKEKLVIPLDRNSLPNHSPGLR